MPKIWVTCPDCGEAWCNAHHTHVHECSCPAIEAWLDKFDEAPYELERSAKVTAWLLTPEGTLSHDD